MVNVKLVKSLDLPEQVIDVAIDNYEPPWNKYIRVQCTLKEMLEGTFWPQLYCLVNVLTSSNNVILANFVIHIVSFWIEDCLPCNIRLLYYIPPIIYWDTFSAPTPRILYVAILSDEPDNTTILPMQILHGYANACIERDLDDLPGMPWYNDICQVLFELQKLNRQWTEQTFDLNLGLFHKMTRYSIYPSNIFEYYDDAGQIPENSDLNPPLDKIESDLEKIKQGEQLVRLSPILTRHMQNDQVSEAQTIIDLVFSQNPEYKRYLENGPRPFNLFSRETRLDNVMFLDDRIL